MLIYKRAVLATGETATSTSPSRTSPSYVVAARPLNASESAIRSMQVNSISGRLAALFVAVFFTALAAFWTSYEPPRVNIRWREGVTAAVRAALEKEHRLT